MTEGGRAYFGHDCPECGGGHTCHENNPFSHAVSCSRKPTWFDIVRALAAAEIRAAEAERERDEWHRRASKRLGPTLRELESLTAENEQLREALQQIVDGWPDDARRTARAALTPKHPQDEG